ncbi:MAG: LysR substrate-binding domain-containing protein [Gammaproteobacteria bacterium]|nr:LysR substrate-binding domain-containing protein [Gammaproteobacteria bacterium]
MARRLRELRHLNALVTFEAAARLGNFSAAAIELHVTRVAVSRQVRLLEDYLGAALFRREHRGVSLTAEGEQLFDSVGRGLGEIAETQQRIRRRRDSGKLGVTMTAAFATFWLIPRMHRFSQAHPDIDLRLVVADDYLDLAREGLDAAIRWGRSGGDDDYEALFPGAQLPMCSREFLRANGPFETPKSLRAARLIHLEGAYRRDAMWPEWFRHFDIEATDLPPGVSVDSYTNMIQAAQGGQGIALGDVPLLDDQLAEGLLVCALASPPVERDRFYLVLPRRDDVDPALALFCNWLRTEAGALADWRQPGAGD